MATGKAIVRIEPNEAGDAYIATHCDGSTSLIPCIDCGSGGTTTPPGLPDNGKTRCLKIGLIAKALKDQFVALIEVNSVGGWMDQNPQQTSQAVLALMVWMTQWGVPVAFFDELRDWILSVTDPTEWYNTHDGGFIGSGYDCLGNFIECCLPEDQTLGDSFFECLYMNFEDPQLECASGDLQLLAAYRMLSGYMQAFGNDYWRAKFWEAIATNQTTNPVNCANFEDCSGSTLGCPPDAVFTQYDVDYEGLSIPPDLFFTWDDTLNGWTTIADCYGNGNYDPCSPNNSRRGIKFQVNTPIGCLQQIMFSFAGNGKTTSTSARIYVNGVIVDSLSSLVGKTRCLNAGGTSPYSVIWVPASPIADVESIGIEFFDLSGTDVAYGLHMHCVHMKLAVNP